MKYQEFVDRKLAIKTPVGINPPGSFDSLFPHQDALVKWALRRGRSAIFADTGLGKTRMELEWARCIASHTEEPVLILAPLAVARQTSAEAQSIGIDCKVAREGDGVAGSGIYVTNYERLHLFDPSVFGGVVLDESSVIKHHDAKTFSQLTEAFKATPYRLCATATPAPNDWTELGTHAEFLGICSRSEMLSEYFCHDGGETQTWRLKGHARDIFWKWVCSWGAMIRKPSDLGFDDSLYNLPPLTTVEHIVQTPSTSMGMLFAMEAQTLQERREARRGSIDARVQACADIVNANDEFHVVWCDLNAESKALTKAIRGAVEITGSDEIEKKEASLELFASGQCRVIVSKPSLCGWGLNWQHCAKMAFVGVTDSWESYYQAVRRCWRFGQKRPVDVHLFASEAEGSVLANLKRKERDSNTMAESLSLHTRDAVFSEVIGSKRSTNIYNSTKTFKLPKFL